MQISDLNLVYTLLCDDVRIEMGNKISLMGIFQNIMANEKCTFKACRVIDGRTLSIRFLIVLWQVEDIGSVAVIVVRPIGHRTQRCSRSEDIGRREHCHQSDETAIRTAIKTNPFWINTVFFYEIIHRIDMPPLNTYIMRKNGSASAFTSGAVLTRSSRYGAAK